MIAESLRKVMSGDSGGVFGLPGVPHLSMYVTNLGDRPGLLIDVELPKGVVLEDGQGFDVMKLGGQARDRVLIRPVRSGPVSPAFISLVEYLHRETSTARSKAEAISVLVDSVQRFRSFFARRSTRLSETALRGFVSELLMLDALVQAGIGPHDALLSWSGPYGSTDFKFVDAAAIEVKTTRVPSRGVRISSEHQLVTPDGGLHLFVLPLATLGSEQSGGVGVLKLVHDMRAKLVESSATAELWDSALEAVGFDETDRYYEAWRFAPMEWQAYSVRDGFPRLVPAMLPDGVGQVSYSLRLETIAEFQEDAQSVIEEVAVVYA